MDSPWISTYAIWALACLSLIFLLIQILLAFLTVVSGVSKIIGWWLLGITLFLFLGVPLSYATAQWLSETLIPWSIKTRDEIRYITKEGGITYELFGPLTSFICFVGAISPATLSLIVTTTIGAVREFADEGKSVRWLEELDEKIAAYEDVDIRKWPITFSMLGLEKPGMDERHSKKAEEKLQALNKRISQKIVDSNKSSGSPSTIELQVAEQQPIPLPPEPPPKEWVFRPEKPGGH